MSEKKLAQATFAAGCFWCTEAVFKRLKGVISVVSGYTGGHTDQPTYEDVSTGQTGHAEAIQITFDPEVISYAKLLDVFWHLHDPTTLNRQGNDVGTQYRSAIFYHDAKQKKIAEESKAKADASGLYQDRIVTEIVPFDKFYPAEAYQQDYFDRNRLQPYCKLVIEPKIRKLYKDFAANIKTETT
jgi:peptide-methionine (S)-S-oxide reductase